MRSKQDFEREKTRNQETSRLDALIHNQNYGGKQTVIMNTFTVDFDV